jgi:hypothetical protein
MEKNSGLTLSDRRSALPRWRALLLELKRIASGPLLGFICLDLAPVVTAAWWKLSFGDVGWSVLLYAIAFAAIGLNASTWLLAAIMVGRTRQLRASWLVLVAVMGALGTAAAVRPDSRPPDITPRKSL